MFGKKKKYSYTDYDKEYIIVASNEKEAFENLPENVKWKIRRGEANLQRIT